MSKYLKSKFEEIKFESPITFKNLSKFVGVYNIDDLITALCQGTYDSRNFLLQYGILDDHVNLHDIHSFQTNISNLESQINDSIIDENIISEMFSFQSIFKAFGYFLTERLDTQFRLSKENLLFINHYAHYYVYITKYHWQQFIKILFPNLEFNSPFTLDLNLFRFIANETNSLSNFSIKLSDGSTVEHIGYNMNQNIIGETYQFNDSIIVHRHPLSIKNKII